MPSTYSNLLYHIVFSTKNREPFIVDSYREQLYSYIGGIIRNEGGSLIQIGGVDDHIHLLVNLKPTKSIAELMKSVKGSCSKWINEQKFISRRFSWQEGYGVFTVSESQSDPVRAYIRNQPEHHKRQSFEEELVAMLNRNGIEYEERYV